MTLPAIYKSADHLKITRLIMPIAINPIERTQHLVVVAIGVKLKRQPSDCTNTILQLNKPPNVLLEALLSKSHILVLDCFYNLLTVGMCASIHRGFRHAIYGNLFRAIAYSKCALALGRHGRPVPSNMPVSEILTIHERYSILCILRS